MTQTQANEIVNNWRNPERGRHLSAKRVGTIAKGEGIFEFKIVVNSHTGERYEATVREVETWQACQLIKKHYSKAEPKEAHFH